MGLFDEVRFEPPQKCSRGHVLGEFQTKDTDVTYTNWTVRDGLLSHDSEDRPPFTGEMSLCAFCRECPAFALKNGNVVQQLIYFEASFFENRLVTLKRTSIDNAEWVKTEPKEKYMKGCLGPMPLKEAMETTRPTRR